MPIYEYQAEDPAKSCGLCRKVFTQMQSISEQPLRNCPSCGNHVKKLFSVPSIGSSVSSGDDRAKKAGFHKLKRLGRGEYEKQY